MGPRVEEVAPQAVADMDDNRSRRASATRSKMPPEALETLVSAEE
jgi:hypothetical protein